MLTIFSKCFQVLFEEEMGGAKYISKRYLCLYQWYWNKHTQAHLRLQIDCQNYESILNQVSYF